MQKIFIPSFQSQILAAFIILIVLDGLYATDQLVALFVPIRYGTFGLLVIGIGILFLSKLKDMSIRKNQLYVVGCHLFLLLYGLLLSSVNSGLPLFEARDLAFTFFSFFLTLALILEFNKNSLFLNSFGSNTPKTNFYIRKINFNSLLVLILVISPFMLYVFEALELTPIPRINFNLPDASRYLQATSRFFGLGSILFLFFALQTKNLASSLFSFSFSFVMLGLCGLGGARGEFLVCILVMFFLLFSFPTRKRNLLLIFTFFAALFSFFLLYAERLDDLLIVQRLSVFSSGNFGTRDQLLIKSFQLLVDRADCALIGCGFNYFQVHFGYDYGNYPHNIFAELLITFGIPLGGAIVVLVCMGASFGFLTSIKRTPLFWVFLYFLGISLKSGSLIGLTPIPVLLYFAYLGILATRGINHSLIAGTKHIV